MIRMSLLKWAAVAALGIASVPVMARTVVPASRSATPAKQVNKSTNPAKPATSRASQSPRPAAARLGNNKRPATAHKNLTSTTRNNTRTTKKASHPQTHQPIKSARPTTLHSKPAHMPTPHSTLTKTRKPAATPSASTSNNASKKPSHAVME